jgi:dTDP-4-dehydrorhamnose reductase
MMKVLVAGSHGLLGSNILPVFDRYFTVIALDIEDWDITDKAMGEDTIRKHKPDVVVNLAAMTNVDQCEDHRDLAFGINAQGAGVVAEICDARNVGLVHISTDYVFDGEKASPYGEDDGTNPLSVYGLSKLAGEQNVLAKHRAPLIVRTQWLYGKGGESFVTKVVRFAREKGQVDVVDDQTGCPTYARDMAEPLMALIEQGRSGIYHMANSGSCTWFALAREIFLCLGMDVAVRPISSQQLNRKAPRPTYSAFDCSKLRRDTGMAMRPWQDALREYLRWSP